MEVSHLLLAHCVPSSSPGNSQRANVLSHNGPCLSKLQQKLHDSALIELHYSRQGHSPKGPDVGLSEPLKGSSYLMRNLGVNSTMKLHLVVQDILKFAAALDESQHKESKAVQNLQWCQLELHNRTAALRGEVVESRVKHMQCAQRLEDAEEELEQVCCLPVSTRQWCSCLLILEFIMDRANVSVASFWVYFLSRTVG